MKKVAEYILIFIAIQFVSITLANGAVMLTGGNIEDKTAEIAIAMSFATFILVVVVFMLWQRSVTFNLSYIKKKPCLQLLFCAVLGFATISPSVFIQNAMSCFEDTNEELFKGMISLPMGFLALAVLGPVTEEIVFRGAILRQLSASLSGNWKDIIISALLFAIIHFNPAQLVHAFIIGILLGWISVKTGSIIPCILIHVINNSTVYFVIKYYPNITLASLPLVAISLILIIISLLGVMRTTTKQ